MTDPIFNDVCTMYEWTRSLKETAERLQISAGKVRKILITTDTIDYSTSNVMHISLDRFLSLASLSEAY